MKSERLSVITAGITEGFIFSEQHSFSLLPKTFMDLDWLEEMVRRSAKRTKCVEN